jgi:sugar lactone lactonase YvrE
VITLTAEVVPGPVMQHGEGPVWDAAHQELLWVDLEAGRVHRGQVEGRTVRVGNAVEVGGTVGAVLPAAEGGWVLIADDGFTHLADDGTTRRLLDLSTERRGETRMNDGAADPAGRLLAGTMAFDERPGAGSFYRVDVDGRVTRQLTGLTIANGVGFSPDGSVLYLADSGTATVWAFDYDPGSGSLGDRRRLISLPPGGGVSDGLCTDDAGCLWVALWGGAQVRRYSPAGEHLATVELPVSQPTSCCFAGPDRDVLVITSSPKGLPEDVRAREPLAGRLFTADVGGTGPAALPYTGVLSGWTEEPATPVEMSGVRS